MPNNTFGDGAKNPDNACYDTQEYSAIKGLQNISPCQYGAPVYVSQPHFYLADPSLLADVDGLTPNKTRHNTFFKIQPVILSAYWWGFRVTESVFLFLVLLQSIGVPLEGKVRVQLNLKVDQSNHIEAVREFRSIVFPIMWLEEVFRSSKEFTTHRKTE